MARRTSVGCAGLPNIKHSNSCFVCCVHIFHYRCWKSYRSPGADQWIHLKEEAYDITIWSYFVFKEEDGSRFTELSSVTSFALRDCTYVGPQAKWQNVYTYTSRVKGKCYELHVNVDHFSCQKLNFLGNILQCCLYCSPTLWIICVKGVRFLVHCIFSKAISLPQYWYWNQFCLIQCRTDISTTEQVSFKL